MQSNPEAEVLLISFDDEGREHLLQQIERAMREKDHEFGMLGAGMDDAEPRGDGWVLNDFYNITCKYADDAPLHVDNSIAISGGNNALRDLYDRLRLLPAGKREFELHAVPHTPRRKRFRFSWFIGTILSVFFLIPAADRFFVAAFSGKDDYFWQMWCYLITAIGVQPMPWLISKRSVWATRINAFLGLLCTASLLILNLEVFGIPSNFFFLPDLACAILLYVFAATFATTSISAFFRKRLRRATSEEAQRLRKSGRLILVLVLIAVLSFCLLLGGIMHAIHYLEGQRDVAFWHRLVNIVILVAFYAQPLWLLAEVLKPGWFRKCCYLLTTCTLIPGLLCVAPVYYLGLSVGSDNLNAYRLVAFAIIIAAASLFFYFRRHIAR